MNFIRFYIIVLPLDLILLKKLLKEVNTYSINGLIKDGD